MKEFENFGKLPERKSKFNFAPAIDEMYPKGSSRVYNSAKTVFYLGASVTIAWASYQGANTLYMLLGK